MKLDLPKIYQQYLAYYSSFRVRFDQLANSRIWERMRAPVMSYKEFTAAWIRWCDQGQEKYWQERFEMGHECHALKFEAAVKSLFIGNDMLKGEVDTVVEIVRRGIHSNASSNRSDISS